MVSGEKITKLFSRGKYPMNFLLGACSYIIFKKIQGVFALLMLGLSALSISIFNYIPQNVKATEFFYFLLVALLPSFLLGFFDLFFSIRSSLPRRVAWLFLSFLGVASKRQKNVLPTNGIDLKNSLIKGSFTKTRKNAYNIDANARKHSHLYCTHLGQYRKQ
jgi:hypothetical protein